MGRCRIRCSGQAPTTRWDPATLNGWGARDYNWQGAISVQHELRPGIGLNAGYFRRWYGNFRVTDNLAVTPQDFDPYCITVPSDLRLPDAGQHLCGLYDVDPALFGREDNLVTNAEHFGKQTEVYDGFEVGMNARIGSGRLTGGVSTGRTDVRQLRRSSTRPADLLPLSAAVERADADQAEWVLSAAWDLRIERRVFRICRVFRSPRAMLPPMPRFYRHSAGTWRNVARVPVCNGTVTLNNLFEPNTEFADRLTQLDLRLTKNHHHRTHPAARHVRHLQCVQRQHRARR